LYDAVVPEFSARRFLARAEPLWAVLFGIGYLGFFASVSAAEFAFWAEFGSRFDFIAVDYLVYTHEVIGNIRESYPIGLWVAGILALCSIAAWFTWPRARGDRPGTRRARWARLAAVGVAIAAGWQFADQEVTATKASAFVRQLSNNGLYAFGHAFRHNQLDYEKYYPVLDQATLETSVRALTRLPNATFTQPHGIERHVARTAPQKNLNVVLISVESLSAEYLGRFGNAQGLTPELDRLADEGLLFSNLYATGTRTVRGLEALSIGTPPTPGQSIVRRPHNAGLENLGEEMRENGWEPYWIYGGYGFFDNMNAYFGSNGYDVVDRTDMDESGLPVHGENIWGIADEDLYSLAIARLDRESAQGKRFFAHIMTTSNHRPYTFPENRVDLPQKHREGAVKYTDWAIGDFIRRSAAKPWFDDTLFIIVADHTAKAAGKTDLPPARYHIPMIWYAPRHLKPAVMDRLMSQIDVGPTLLGWLGLEYSSRFFGYDMFTLEPGRERAFISTYQKLGYLRSNRLVVLDVGREPVVVPFTGGPPPAPKGAPPPDDRTLIDEAITWYQSASLYFNSGQLTDVEDSDDDEPPAAAQAKEGAGTKTSANLH
jgi:phosphoglycerol transferase MdoB-like AlkP superfamily enzyme